MTTLSLNISGAVASSITMLSLTDPSGNPVALNVPPLWTNRGGGTWAYTFSGSSNNYVYVYQIAWTGGGASGPFTGQFAANQPAGYYGALADLNNEFGTANIAAWSQLDATQTNPDGSPLANYSRIQTACNYGDARINTVFRNSRYVVPLLLNSGQAEITSVWAQIAGIWLYDARARLDTTLDGKRYTEQLTDVYASLNPYLIGQRFLDAKLNQRVQTTPTISGGL